MSELVYTKQPGGIVEEAATLARVLGMDRVLTDVTLHSADGQKCAARPVDRALCCCAPPRTQLRSRCSGGGHPARRRPRPRGPRDLAPAAAAPAAQVAPAHALPPPPSCPRYAVATTPGAMYVSFMGTKRAQDWAANLSFRHAVVWDHEDVLEVGGGGGAGRAAGEGVEGGGGGV